MQEIRLRHNRFVLTSLALFICLIPFSGLLAENRDSLYQKLKSIPNVESRIRAIHDFAWKYRRTDPSFTIALLKEAEGWAKETNDYGALAENYNFIGVAQRNLGNYPEAINLFFQALKLSENYELKDTYKKEYGYSLNNIADIYQRIDDIPNAIRYSRQAVKAFERIADTTGLAYAYLRLGETYQSAKQYDSALSAYTKTYELRLRTGTKEQIATTLTRLAKIHLQQGRPKLALRVIQEADLLHPLPLHVEASLKSTEAEILYSNESYFQAALIADTALSIASEINAKEVEVGIYYTLYKVYDALKNPAKALLYHVAYSSLNDSLLNESAFSKIAETRLSFELQKKNDEIEILELKAERQQLLIIFFILLAVFLGVLISLIWNRNIERKRVNKTLEDNNRVISDQNLEIVKQKDELELQSKRLEQALKRKNEAFDELSVVLHALRIEKDKANEQKRIADEANRFKSELLGIAAHDLKGPISIIRGYSTLLKEFSDLTAEKRDMIERIGEGCDRMLKLINDLLSTTAIDSGTFQFSITECSINEIVSTVVEQNRFLAEKKNQQITLTIKGMYMTKTDPERLKAVIDNILSNAVKYSPKGSPIGIEVTSLPKRVFQSLPQVSSLSGEHIALISVRDTGPGFTAEEKEKLFKRFQRLSVRPTGDEQSTGLGLSIAKEFITLLGGTVWAESEGKDKGSTFIIALPLEESHPVEMGRGVISNAL